MIIVTAAILALAAPIWTLHFMRPSRRRSRTRP